MIFPAVFILSLVSLSYEVMLTRFFSISQWNHLSFMVISIVLFGFAVSGTFLSLMEARRPGLASWLSQSSRQWALLILFSISVAGSFLGISRIPLDYFSMPLQWLQALYLLITFIMLTVPFFFSGLIIVLAYASLPKKAGWIYFYSMLGSACGALLPSTILPLLGEGRIIIISVLFPLMLALITACFLNCSRPKKLIFLSINSVLVFILFFLIMFEKGIWLEIKPSPYKLLAQVLQFPDTRVTRSYNSLRGRLDLVESPYIRFTPGLSLKYQGTIPEKRFIIHDADDMLVMYEMDSLEDAGFARYTHSFAAYMLIPKEAETLIIMRGGGLGLPCALEAEALKITLLVELPQAAEIFRAQYKLPGLNVKAQDARSYLAQDPAQYDLIQVENWGASIPGMASLNQEHLLTVEALTEYLLHLKKRGILIVSRKLHLPPSDSIRLYAGASQALLSMGAEEPEEHIIILRNWDSYTLLVTPLPFRTADIARVREFSLSLNFDLVHYPGIRRGEVNRFNVFDEPYHFESIEQLTRALKSGKQEGYFKDYLLDVAPATDDRPFHNRFTRWLRIGELYRSTGSRFYSLLMSGEIVVMVVLVEAFFIGLVLLILPLRSLSGGSKRVSIWTVLYFLFTGAGFMFVELSFIQNYTLLFGDPVVAFTIVLGGMLIFSGLGGAVSSGWSKKRLKYALASLVLLIGVMAILKAPIINALLSCRGVLQGTLAVIVLFPISFLIGVPFPVGLRLLMKRKDYLAYAWAANGAASVVASILALPLAMAFSISSVLWAAALTYSFVFMSLRFTKVQL